MLEAEDPGLWPWSRERSCGKLDMDSRDMAQGGSCGGNVRGQDRRLVDSEHLQAGQLHGHKTCVVTQTPHRGGSVRASVLCCCHLQIPTKFLNTGFHIFFTQAPVNCVVSFAHVTESRAQARLSRPQ